MKALLNRKEDDIPHHPCSKFTLSTFNPGDTDTVQTGGVGSGEKGVSLLKCVGRKDTPPPMSACKSYQPRVA